MHLITDDAVLAGDTFLDVADAVLERCGRAVALHLRGSAATGARLYACAEQLNAVALRTGAWLFINDRIDIAMAVRAHGVQLGARSVPIADARALLGPGVRVGSSVHAAEEVALAEADGADFVVVGTIFESASHAGRPAAGLDRVRQSVAGTALPVIAIGGVTPERVAAVAAAGAHGAAVLGGVWRAADPAAAAAEYAERARDAWRNVPHRQA